MKRYNNNQKITTLRNTRHLFFAAIASRQTFSISYCAVAFAIFFCVLSFSPASTIAYAAQNNLGLSSVHNIPEQALSGELIITTRKTGTLNGNAVRLASGLRIFNQKGALVPLHKLFQKPLIVKYIIERNTNAIIKAWLEPLK